MRLLTLCCTLLVASALHVVLGPPAGARAPPCKLLVRSPRAPPPPPATPATSVLRRDLLPYSALVALGGLPLVDWHGDMGSANAARLGYFFCLAVGTCYVGARRADLGEVSPVGGQQAVLAPVFASFTLGGLYLLIKNTELDPATVYRGVACVFALLSGVELLQPLFGLLASGEPLRPVSAPPLNSRREEAVMRAGAAPALATAAALVVLYLQGPISTGGTLTLPTFAFVNNYLAWSITTVTLGVVSLESFAAGAILLIGLFCYDAFFVFQSDVMITAA